MNTNWTSTIKEKRKKQRRNRRLLLCTVLLILTVTIRALLPEAPKQDIESISEQVSAEIEHTPAQPVPVTPPPPDNIFAHDIAAGDNLSAIFDSLMINQQSMLQILAADEQLLALDVLRPGNRLTFTLNETTRDLETMELFIHPGKQVAYQRVDGDHFEYQEIDVLGTWQEQIVSGKIEGNFILSAINAGLSEQEAANITDLFEGQLNFSRDLRAGDQFQVVRSQQFIGDEKTGQSQLLGIRISGQRYQLDGFLFDDGNYYDHNGESLARAFRRYPFTGKYRISSSFNPRRRHPVTKRISPHNGTDFAMPTGTSVLAAGDGVVTRIKNHPYAGKYVEIQHGKNYKTRYLHLSKFIAKRGQRVKRGQRIALSGNTGRSTGPHLHYELHIKGRVVNAVRAKIPMAASIPNDKRDAFRAKVDQLTALMEHPEQNQIAHVGEQKTGAM
jgi:murein DD-endopeptidase